MRLARLRSRVDDCCLAAMNSGGILDRGFKRGSIAITLFYYDQRIRREGYDIERMMQSAGLNAPQNPSAEGAQVVAEPVEGRA